MSSYLDNVRAKLEAFDAQSQALVTRAAARTDAAALACQEAGPRLAAATKKLRATLAITERTAADVADMRHRLEGEARELGRALEALGHAFPAPPPGATRPPDPLLPYLYLLEESAQRVAAALFPSAIDGLKGVNAALWEIRPVQKQYARMLDETARRAPAGLSPADLDAAKAAASEIMAGFDAVDALVEQLATAPLVGEGREARDLITEARARLHDAIDRARRAEGKAFAPFRHVLDQAADVAQTVLRRIAKLRVPVFPPLDRLDAFSSHITHDLYQNLAGVERFALMNIGARIRSVAFGTGPDDHLASPRFEIRVFDVFPDRVYFTATREFLTTLQALAADSPSRRHTFVKAPAGLHKFNDGSFKQVRGSRGNLQVSYALGTDTDPGDPHRLRVDADIDLYRGAVAHLFGEVLVNHLTGSKTSQFKVFDTLAENHVAPLGGFDVITV
jgi:hypothetical protein